MPRIPILMPQLGESVSEAVIMHILVKPGDSVQADQEVMEVETNKAVMEVTTVCGGTIAQISVAEGETVPVGTVMGIVEATEEEARRCGAVEVQPRDAQPLPPSTECGSGTCSRVDGAPMHSTEDHRTDSGGLPVPLGVRGAHYLSPRLRARMDELGITEADMAYIVGTGAGGRITISDFEKFLEYVDGWPSRQASPMRRSVADSMQRTWRRPIASAGRPVCMAPIILHRKGHPLRPGYTLYFVRALAIALAEVPECAGYMVGGRILTPKKIDIGVAVQVNDGVLVPVMRCVDQATLDEQIGEFNKIVSQARSRKLDDKYKGGGIATVTNFGSFGLTYAAPMPLPSESLILGVAAMQKVPVWSDEVQCFIPIEKANISASFDHRVVDGGDIGRLMQRIAYLLEHPELL